MKLSLFPEVSNGPIKVTPFCDIHLTPKYVSWLNDPEVVRYSEQRHYTYNIQKCRDYFLSQQKSDNYFLAIEHQDNLLGHIGNIGVKVDHHNNIADLAIMIGDKRAWGKGIGSRAWKVAIKTLLNTLNFRMVTAGTLEVNSAMVQLMLNSGMQIDGVFPRRFLWEGSEVGLVMASVFSEVAWKRPNENCVWGEKYFPTS